MITHKINFIKKIVEVATTTPTKSSWPWTGRAEREKEERKTPWWAGAFSNTKRMNKLEYAKYLGELPHKKGDILIHAHHFSYDNEVVPNMEPLFFYEVCDIQELHAHVDYHTDAATGNEYPKCLWMRQLDGGNRSGFFACADWWTIVPPEKYPPKLLAYLKERDIDNPLNQIQ